MIMPNRHSLVRTGSRHRPRVKPGATGWGCGRYFELADDIIQIRACGHPMLAFFEVMVVCQLLAMEIAIRLDADVDMPRNLAKTVTVE